MNTRPRTRTPQARLAIGVCLALVLGACSGSNNATTTNVADPPEQLTTQVIATVAHDPSRFTEGLEINGATLYESSGMYGSSKVVAQSRATGEVQHTYTLPTTMFGEGLTRVGDKLVVLTWREHTAIVLDAATLTEKSRLTYDGEGWGACASGSTVITSDGTDVLTVRDANSFAPRRTLLVRMAGSPVRDINELECVDNTIYANVWKTNRILRIDAATGMVNGFADVADLRPPSTTADADAVLNGIAYDAKTATFFITGKRWPVMYEVKFAKPA